MLVRTRQGGERDVSAPNRQKLQFWLDENEADKLRRLAEDMNHTTLSELIRNALSVYAWSARTIREGGELQLVDRDGKTHVVVLPGFYEVAQGQE